MIGWRTAGLGRSEDSPRGGEGFEVVWREGKGAGGSAMEGVAERRRDSWITIRAAARAESSAPTLEVSTPAGAPISRKGVMPSFEKRTPIPAPPLGSGRGRAEPSVRTMV